MTELPPLDVWVTDECPACARTLKVLDSCECLRAVVSVCVRRLGDPRERPPLSVVGGPAIVFQGKIISLGTPDCVDLFKRIMLITRSRAEMEDDG